MKNENIAEDLSNIADVDIFNNPNIAHLFIHHHKVVRSHSLEGLHIDTEEKEDSIHVKLRLDDNINIENPVHMCFGMFPKEGVQHLVLDIETGENSSINILSHCIFPNGTDLKHIMDAEIKIGKNSNYSYLEKHIHPEDGGIKVYPKANVNLMEGANFRSEFELLKGRAGIIDIDYETNCGKNSVLEMIARINAKGEDLVKINETGHLNGERARGFLNSRVAAREKAKADVYNKITASGAYARGHVDCKEIIKDDGVVSAIPIVEVSNPKAHITHEASLGSVDSKQLQTLMSRGLSEDEATELIIKGLLS